MIARLPSRRAPGDLRSGGILQRLGAQDVIHLAGGGVPRWQRQGWAIEALGRGAA